MGNWLAGAKVIKGLRDGGSMTGGSPRVVWHTTENDPKTTSATNIANYLNNSGNQVHIVWNPVTGEIVQMIPADRAGRGLENHAGGVETNRQGTVCIQIEVVGKATQPFTATACKGLDQIVTWLRSLGIPDAWPSGSPLPYPKSYGSNGQRAVFNWSKGGHFSHSQVPENVHGDPGAVDITKILSAGVRPVVPAPRPPVVVTPAKPVPHPIVTRLQTAIHLKVANGLWDATTDAALRAVRYGFHPGINVRNLQALVGTTVDGAWGKNSTAALVATIKAIQHILGVTTDGDWGPKTEAAFVAQRKRLLIH